MKRRALVIAGAVVSVTGWALFERRRADGSPAPGVAAAGQDHSVDRRRTLRLTRLRERLREVRSVSDAQPDERITRIAREIASLEAELAAPPPAGDVTTPGNEEYRRQHLRRRAERQGEVLARRRAVVDRLRERPPAREAGPLTTVLIDLEAELAQIGTMARAFTGADRVRQMHDVRSDLEERIADLRLDLTYWSGQRSGAGGSGREARIRALERQIQDQEAALRGENL